ncbi:tRNA 2-thiouridine(34) synthase MnmA [Candidatus Uhrbacteria bacterium]|nr:tRNA 2-thiouridine(34) synthase MnmA [Candidatus Uhrbacteria bacterium]
MPKAGATVLVGMSGGVDSSVAAALLVKRGYRVVGGFIKNWSDSKDLQTGECAWRGERRDAMRVAAKLGVPLLTFDFEKEYRKKIVGDLFRGYAAGETPNPDVLCNEAIKFGMFFEAAKRLGAEFIATGHYARVKRGRDGVAHLLRGLDPDKDQSYFLYRVPQEALGRTFFPIGQMKKSQVRDLARRLKLPVAEKPDSQGICFIGKLDMVDFLRKKIKPKPGDIVDQDGAVIGRHQGLDAFTIGQRERIQVAKGTSPWFVAGKDVKNNRLVVVQGADNPLLYRNSLEIHDVRWCTGKVPKLPLDCSVQVRYRQSSVKAVLAAGSKGAFKLNFRQPVKAVASGQSAVIYRGMECLGGGLIA